MATQRKIKWLNALIRSVWTESEQFGNSYWNMLRLDGIPSIGCVKSRVRHMQIEDITHMLMEIWFDAQTTAFRS